MWSTIADENLFITVATPRNQPTMIRSQQETANRYQPKYSQSGAENYEMTDIGGNSQKIVYDQSLCKKPFQFSKMR